MTGYAGDWAIRPLGIVEYQIYLSWFNDTELRRRVSITPEWFAYVTQTTGVYAWMIFKADEPIAVVQFDAEPARAVAVSVNPAMRGRGYCKQVLRLAFQQPEFRSYETVCGSIEPDNIASLRCVASLEFARLSDTLDDDGMIGAVFTLSAVTPLN